MLETCTKSTSFDAAFLRGPAVDLRNISHSTTMLYRANELFQADSINAIPELNVAKAPEALAVE